MKINTGQGTIPLITLIGIWSISALTSLPGLAVSPIWESSPLFSPCHGVGYTDVDFFAFLTDYPVCIVGGQVGGETRFYPFAAGGALAVCRKRGTLFVFFQDVATDGCQRFARYRGGIDYSSFYGADFSVFHGRVSRQTVWIQFRHNQYDAGGGYGRNGLFGRGTLAFAFCRLSVAADFFGSFGLFKKNTVSVTVKQASAVIPSMQSAPVISGKYGIHIRHLIQLMLFYGVVTYVVLAVTFNLPFLMEAHHFSSGNSGLMISLFFLAIMAPGFMLDNIVKLLGNKTKLYSLLAVAVGLLLIWISPTEWLIVPGCILVGLGYGIIQPLIYDKTVDTAIPQKQRLPLLL